MKKYLITGLLIWIPLAITIWVRDLTVSTMDQSLLLLPPQYQPQVLLGYQIPGLGALLTLVVVFATGVLASNILGQRLLWFWEYVLGRIPVVKTIYNSVKQVSDTLFAPGGQAFRKALLVQYPREGSWTIAFLTGRPGGDVANHLHGDYLSVYVPTTPNHTSGFFLMLRKAGGIERDMGVDQDPTHDLPMRVAGRAQPS